jgi:hypothetical protein
MSENIATAVSDKLSSGTGGSRGVKRHDADANKSPQQQQQQQQQQQPPHHVIDYNKDLEYLLKDNAEECESLGILHRASYEKYNRLSNYINIPVIILSSAIGFATGIDIGYEKMNIILGIGSIFVGIIKSIDTYFQLGKRSESHRLCSLQYQQIHKKIQIELALKRPQRQTAKDMMTVIKTDIKNLQDISPLIDQDIIDAYNERYGKYTTVKKPNFVNGLTEVVVNDTDSGEDVLHSRSRSESGSIDGYEETDNGFQNNSRRSGLGDGGGGGSGLPVKVDAFGQQLNNNSSTAVSASLVFRNPTELNPYFIQPPVQNHSSAASTPTPIPTPPPPQLLQPTLQDQLQQLQQLQNQLRQNPNIIRSNGPSPRPAANYPPPNSNSNSNPITNPNTGTHTPSSELNAIINQVDDANVNANANDNNNVVFTVVPDPNEDGAMM